MILRLLFILSLTFLISACTERRQLNYLDKAEKKLSENDIPEATKLFKKAILLDTDSKAATKAYYRLGYALEIYLKDYEGSLLNYIDFIKHSEDVVSIYEVLKRVGNIYFQHILDSEKAIETYNKLIVLSPDSLEADFFYFRVAQSFFRLNRFEESRNVFQKFLEKFPKSQMIANVRYSIANTYYMESQYDIAIEALKQVLRHHQNSELAMEASFLMAQCFEHQGKLQNALEIYKSLEGKYPIPEILGLRIKEISKRLRSK